MGLHFGRKVATQLTAHRDGSVGRDCPRRGTHFSTARKVSKRATPRSGFWAAGPKVPCASRNRRAGTTRYAQTSARLIADCCDARPKPTGENVKSGGSFLAFRSSSPFCRAEHRSSGGKRPHGCLSAASSVRPLRCEKHREPRKAGRGSWDGFLWFLSLPEQRKKLPRRGQSRPKGPSKSETMVPPVNELRVAMET
jgi:hypothetical protein